MTAVIGVRIPRGKDGIPLTGLAQEITRAVSKDEAAAMAEQEEKVLGEIATVLAPAFAEFVKTEKERSGIFHDVL